MLLKFAAKGGGKIERERILELFDQWEYYMEMEKREEWGGFSIRYY
jgi:hypothetical protein